MERVAQAVFRVNSALNVRFGMVDEIARNLSISRRVIRTRPLPAAAP
jgi:hypothetical protein